jgi:hypothetical protein
LRSRALTWEFALRRRQAPSIEFQRFIPILKEVRELLLKYDLVATADYASSLIDMAEFESPAFVEHLGMGGLWNMGGVFDTQFSSNFEGDPDLLRADDRRLSQLAVRLVDEMKRQGVRYRGIERQIRAWRNWVVEGASP